MAPCFIFISNCEHGRAAQCPTTDAVVSSLLTCLLALHKMHSVSESFASSRGIRRESFERRPWFLNSTALEKRNASSPAVCLHHAYRNFGHTVRQSTGDSAKRRQWAGRRSRDADES